MKHALRIGGSLARLGVFIILAAGNVFAQPATSSAAAIDKDYIKTNGAFVTIGSFTVKTNHPWNTDEEKEFRRRIEQLHRMMNSRATNAMEQFVSGAWALIKDYPARPNGYQCIMSAIEMYESGSESPKARALADELIASSAPQRYKRWARGLLNRLDSQGKPVSLEFTAVDGRKVDLLQMRGKVVLVDFWGTRCGPCVAELPRVKAAFDKFHGQGFEVIGISCDTSLTSGRNEPKAQ
jgi:thiol-disulfide isomerase/thioredoxin